MSSSFGVVEEKVYESEFFLGKLIESDFFEARFYFSAFVSAARSVTFALQFSMNGVNGFGEWYSKAQASLKSDTLTPLFKEIRNDIIHKGINPFNSVPPEVLADFMRNQLLRDSNRNHFLFVKVAKSEWNQIEVIQASKQYMKLLVTLIYDCYFKYCNVVDPRWYFTEENFRKLGKTIEDALEELGFPRTWFDGMSIGHEAWRAIRHNVALCPLNPLFDKYLGKIIPDPDEGTR